MSKPIVPKVPPRRRKGPSLPKPKRGSKIAAPVKRPKEK